LNRRYSEEEEVKQCVSEDENQSKSFSSLKVPELKHNHLISPPPSPPEDWQQTHEEINRIPYFDLTPVFIPESNQTILFQPRNQINNTNNSTTGVMEIEEEDSSNSSSSSFYESLSSSSSSVQNASPKSSLRTKRKKEDQLFRLSSDHCIESSSIVFTSSDEHPQEIIQSEKEARRRRNNSHNYRVSSLSKLSLEDNSEEENSFNSRISLPSILITHESLP